MVQKQITDDGKNITIISNSDLSSLSIKVIPKELIKQLAALDKIWVSDIETALWFYNVTKDAEEYRWLTAADLVGLNTIDYDVHFYENAWEDSFWNVFVQPWTFRLTKEDTIDAYYGDEDIYCCSLNLTQPVLLTKVSEEKLDKRKKLAEEYKS